MQIIKKYFYFLCKKTMFRPMDDLNLENRQLCYKFAVGLFHMRFDGYDKDRAL